ncbi:hypothetical protein MMC22_010050, partial [Lobaria immixta]|nr:hypothetical protein [Lobaria immixta]
PIIGLTSSSLNDTYLVILVDPNAGKPEFIHWFQTNFTLSASEITIASLSFHPLLSTTPPLAPYVKPQPPPGTGFHRYIELLFSQPANFSIPANYTHFFSSGLSSRSSFNVTSFARDAGLSKPVAANYFLTENSTAGENQTAATGTGSASRTATGGSGQGEILLPSLH